MRYFLDFDRTLFDTDSFVAYLAGRSRTSDPPPLTEAELIHEAEGISFEPGELSQFLYEDAARFLREKENATTIITFGNARFQEMKIKSALYGIPRMSVMYTDGVHKGDYLSPHTHLHTGAVLTDDFPSELEILASTCPTLGLYEMRRDGEAGDGRWPVIRSLSELP